MGVESMKDWDNFGDNDSIDSMFEDNVCTKRTVGQEPEPQPEILEDEEDVQIEDDGPEIIENVDDEKLTQYRTAKYSDRDIEKLAIIKLALGFTTDSEAIRWCLKTAYDYKGEDLEIIAKEIEKIERKMRKIRAQQ